MYQLLTVKILTRLVNGTKKGACFNISDAFVFSSKACMERDKLDQQK